LLHDYVVPVTVPEHAVNTVNRPEKQRLDGFPLLHIDNYLSDPAGLNWPDWTARFGHRANAAGRGIHYRSVASAMESLLYGAGFALCGLSLIAPLLDAGHLAMPLPLSEGAWT